MKPARTGGGRFDPKEGPIYFLATSGGHMPYVAGHHGHILVAVNELESRTARERVELYMDADPEHKVFLDSGIFWLTNRYARKEGLSMDDVLTLDPHEVPGFPELLTRYVEIVKKWESRLWGYVELDQGGAENKRRTRAALEAEGLRPIPVYHPFLDGWDYFDELAGGYDRMCFGNIVQSSKPDRLRLVATMAERKRAYPNLWVHLLGMSPTASLLATPTNSCDSSAWLAGMVWMQGYQTFGYNTVRDIRAEEWRYRYGADVPERQSRPWASRFSIAECGYGLHAWRAIAARRRELGEDPWPRRRKGEPLPQPADRKGTP